MTILRILPSAWKRWLFDEIYLRFLDPVTALAMSVPFPSFRLWYLVRVLKWNIAPGVTIERAVRIIGGSPASLGVDSHVNQGAVLDTRGGLTIGERVDIARGAQILTADHNPQSPQFELRYRPVHVGDRVWIATNAVILPGCTVEDGVVLGANAVAPAVVLTADSIYVGNPAKRARDRFEQAQSGKHRTRARW